MRRRSATIAQEPEHEVEWLALTEAVKRRESLESARQCDSIFLIWPSVSVRLRYSTNYIYLQNYSTLFRFNYVQS